MDELKLVIFLAWSCVFIASLDASQPVVAKFPENRAKPREVSRKTRRKSATMPDRNHVRDLARSGVMGTRSLAGEARWTARGARRGGRREARIRAKFAAESHYYARPKSRDTSSVLGGKGGGAKPRGKRVEEARGIELVLVAGGG